MNTVDEYIDAVRKLKSKSPATVIFLPPNSMGMPIGSYNLKTLLEFVALNLEGKIPSCR